MILSPSRLVFLGTILFFAEFTWATCGSCPGTSCCGSFYNFNDGSSSSSCCSTLPSGVNLKWPLAPGSLGVTCAYGCGWHSNVCLGSVKDYCALDLVSYTGDNSIRSATSGTVHAKSSTGDLGNRIVINEGSVKVQYAHMASQSTLSIGATVQQGDTLGTIGATGNTGGFAHLHFSVFSSGATCNSGNACWGGSSIKPEPMSGTYGIGEDQTHSSDNGGSPTPPTPPTPPSCGSACQVWLCAASGVNFRSCPSLGCGVFWTIGQGTAVTRLDNCLYTGSGFHWYRISVSGYTGYVAIDPYGGSSPTWWNYWYTC